jgi:SAM-dependent methyltransferase
MGDEPYAPHAPLGLDTATNPAHNQPVDRCIANIWPERTRFQAILDALPAEVDRLLDVGVVRHEQGRRGYGNLHAQLHMAYPEAEIVGIDTDAAGVKRMRSPGYDVREKNAETMRFDRPFDVIVAGEVIEHLANPGAFVDSAAAHLQPGGSIVMTTPNPDAMRYFRKAVTGNWTSPDHTCWISPQHLEHLADLSDWDWSVTVEYLAPPKGLSKWLYDHNRKRIGATSYLATLQMEGGE